MTHAKYLKERRMLGGSSVVEHMFHMHEAIWGSITKAWKKQG